MKVLVADKFEQSGIDGLQALGCEISYQPDLKDDALVEAVRQIAPDVLVVRGTKVTEPMRCWTSETCRSRRRGLQHDRRRRCLKTRDLRFELLGKNSIAVAELAFALILALDRRIADNVVALRQGTWNKKEFSKARGFGRTLGLIGVGKIGQEMIPRARAFGMPVVAWSRSLTRERAAELGVELMPRRRLLLLPTLSVFIWRSSPRQET